MEKPWLTWKLNSRLSVSAKTYLLCREEHFSYLQFKLNRSEQSSLVHSIAIEHLIVISCNLSVKYYSVRHVTMHEFLAPQETLQTR